MSKDKNCTFVEYRPASDKYSKCDRAEKRRKEINRKKKSGPDKGRGMDVQGLGNPSANLSGTGPAGGGNGGGMGEGYKLTRQPSFKSFLYDEDNEDFEYLEDYENYEEDQAEEPSKEDQAKQLYQLLRGSGYTRKEIVAQLKQRLGLSDSTALEYYERSAREFGDSERGGAPGMAPVMSPLGDIGGAGVPGGMGDEMGMGPGGEGEAGMGAEEEPYQEVQDWDDPDRQGTIRTVDNAHLVYKRQQDDGSFEELWVYKEDSKFKGGLEIRRDILSGTDIPVTKTKSDDGRQRAETWTVGNVHFINISGLIN